MKASRNANELLKGNNLLETLFLSLSRSLSTLICIADEKRKKKEERSSPSILSNQSNSRPKWTLLLCSSSTGKSFSSFMSMFPVISFGRRERNDEHVKIVILINDKICSFCYTFIRIFSFSSFDRKQRRGEKRARNPRTHARFLPRYW